MLKDDPAPPGPVTQLAKKSRCDWFECIAACVIVAGTGVAIFAFVMMVLSYRETLLNDPRGFRIPCDSATKANVAMWGRRADNFTDLHVLGTMCVPWFPVGRYSDIIHEFYHAHEGVSVCNDLPRDNGLTDCVCVWHVNTADYGWDFLVYPVRNLPVGTDPRCPKNYRPLP